MNLLRRNLMLSGLVGLLACGLTASLAAWLSYGGIVEPLLPYPLVTLLLVLVFGGFSMAEIPLMVFTMRRLLVERQGNYSFVLGLNALFCFFAAVYGAPVLLLTGSLSWGLGLCGLGIARLAASLAFIRPPPSGSGNEDSKQNEFEDTQQ
jgi:hypothetical protein